MKWVTFVFYLEVQPVDRWPCLGYLKIQLGPKNMIRWKVKIVDSTMLSDKNPVSGQELNRSGITFVQVDLDTKFWQFLNALHRGTELTVIILKCNWVMGTMAECPLGCHIFKKVLVFTIQHLSSGVHTHKTWLGTKKIPKFFVHLLAGPDYPHPGGLACLEVPGEYFFGLKLKIYVKITYFE